MDTGFGVLHVRRVKQQVLEEVLASMTQASEQPSAPRAQTRSASIDGHDALLDACGAQPPAARSAQPDALSAQPDARSPEADARSAKLGARAAQLDALGIKELRARTKLSQSDFAALLGVELSTLRNWEQGRRVPTGPAHALLRAIRNDPQNVIRALARAA
jgi:putative transcriptional regulator